VPQSLVGHLPGSGRRGSDRSRRRFVAGHPRRSPAAHPPRPERTLRGTLRSCPTCASGRRTPFRPARAGACDGSFRPAHLFRGGPPAPRSFLTAGNTRSPVPVRTRLSVDLIAFGSARRGSAAALTTNASEGSVRASHVAFIALLQRAAQGSPRHGQAACPLGGPSQRASVAKAAAKKLLFQRSGLSKRAG